VPRDEGAARNVSISDKALAEAIQVLSLLALLALLVQKYKY
jgi:hypothetical protein